VGEAYRLYPIRGAIRLTPEERVAYLVAKVNLTMKAIDKRLNDLERAINPEDETEKI